MPAAPPPPPPAALMVSKPVRVFRTEEERVVDARRRQTLKNLIIYVNETFRAQVIRKGGRARAQDLSLGAAAERLL